MDTKEVEKRLSNLKILSMCMKWYDDKQIN